MHGDNVRKAIKDTDSRNKITQGVNDYAKTNPLNFSGKQWPLEKSMKTDKTTKYTPKSGAEPGNTVKEQVDKVRKTNDKARAINDYEKVTGKEPSRNQNRKAFRVNSLKHNKPGQPKSTAPKYKAEAGSGSIPSGTNTNIPKYKAQAGCDPMEGRRKKPDGSFGY